MISIAQMLTLFCVTPPQGGLPDQPGALQGALALLDSPHPLARAKALLLIALLVRGSPAALANACGGEIARSPLHLDDKVLTVYRMHAVGDTAHSWLSCCSGR